MRAELFGRWAGGRVEFSNELDEYVSELWNVDLCLGADNFDHLTVAVRCLPFLAPRLVHHYEAIPSVVHVRKALKEIASGGLGLFQLTGFHEVDRGVGGGGQLFEFIIHRAVIGKPLKDRGFRRKLLGATGCGALLARGLILSNHLPLGGFVLRLAALLVFLTTAAVAWIIASGFGHDGQHLGLGGLLLYSTLLADATFHELLLAYDRDLADTAREAGCPCGGVLHSAKYPRKPRPWLCRLGLEHQRRFSYCCAVDGCRSRATPPSLRFLGRKVYLATIVVLVSMMQHGVTDRRMRQLTEAVGVDRRTVARWQLWWREDFTASAFWQMARAVFIPPVEQNRLPAALIERFRGDGAEPLIALLRFIAPITGGKTQAR